MFFKIIKAIGPIKSPINPQNLKPVYIAINVNIGCIPICPLTTLGSNTCLTTHIIIHSTSMETPSVMSPLNAVIIAHGTITVPEPKIGSASTIAIPIADINGYWTLSPATENPIKPIKEITNEIPINFTWAFR